MQKKVVPTQISSTSLEASSVLISYTSLKSSFEDFLSDSRYAFWFRDQVIIQIVIFFSRKINASKANKKTIVGFVRGRGGGGGSFSCKIIKPKRIHRCFFIDFAKTPLTSYPGQLHESAEIQFQWFQKVTTHVSFQNKTLLIPQLLIPKNPH